MAMVLTYCLLTIYVVIAWHIWRYGGSYSCRALVQSYPVFSFPLACVVERFFQSRLRFLWLLLAAYLIVVNLFQITQYNRAILHYDDMNRNYYRAIYLNPHPAALDMSLLDTDEMLRDANNYIGTELPIQFIHDTLHGPQLLSEHNFQPATDYQWLHIESDLYCLQGMWGSWLKTTLIQGNSRKQVKVRLYNPLSKEGITNHYSFYVKLTWQNRSSFKVRLETEGSSILKIIPKKLVLTGLSHR